MEFPRPNIVVSKCLNFCKCRYNGQKLYSKFIEFFKDYMNFYPVCPEVEIGLGVPRTPVRIIQQEDKEYLKNSDTGEDYTEKMNSFSESFLNNLKDIDGFILKSRSPTCGIKDVKKYKNTGKVPPMNDKTTGFFASKAKNKFPKAAFEDDGRLTNFSIREHFLIKIYTLAKFRQIKKSNKMKYLIKFHQNNKYLFMSYSQNILNKLGKIVSNHEKLDIQKVLNRYEEELNNIFSKYRKEGRNINAFLHMFGYFSDKLTKEEKDYFQNQIEFYKNDMVPLSVLTAVLKSWVIRFDNDYLKNQTILNPYPDSLIKVTDSGKGREFR